MTGLQADPSGSPFARGNDKKSHENIGSTRTVNCCWHDKRMFLPRCSQLDLRSSHRCKFLIHPHMNRPPSVVQMGTFLQFCLLKGMKVVEFAPTHENCDWLLNTRTCFSLNGTSFPAPVKEILCLSAIFFSDNISCIEVHVCSDDWNICRLKCLSCVWIVLINTWWPSDSLFCVIIKLNLEEKKSFGTSAQMWIPTTWKAR